MKTVVEKAKTLELRPKPNLWRGTPELLPQLQFDALAEPLVTSNILLDLVGFDA